MKAISLSIALLLSLSQPLPAGENSSEAAIMGTWTHNEREGEGSFELVRDYRVTYNSDHTFRLEGSLEIRNGDKSGKCHVLNAGRYSIADGRLTHEYSVNTEDDYQGDSFAIRVLKAVHEKTAAQTATSTIIKSIDQNRFVLLSDTTKRDLIFNRVPATKNR